MAIRSSNVAERVEPEVRAEAVVLRIIEAGAFGCKCYLAGDPVKKCRLPHSIKCFIIYKLLIIKFLKERQEIII